VLSLDLEGRGIDIDERHAIAALPRLRLLRLSNAPPSALKELLHLDRLPHLELDGCFDLVDLAPLHEHPSLRQLSLRHCPKVPMTPGWIPRSIRSLSLSSMGITTLSGLSGATALRKLRVYETDHRGAGIDEISHVEGLENLEELDLGYSRTRSLEGITSLHGLVTLNLGGSVLTSLSGVE
jgi:Leucine-rich repeat (LRR) protein